MNAAIGVRSDPGSAWVAARAIARGEREPSLFRFTPCSASQRDYPPRDQEQPSSRDLHNITCRIVCNVQNLVGHMGVAQMPCIRVPPGKSLPILQGPIKDRIAVRQIRAPATDSGQCLALTSSRPQDAAGPRNEPSPSAERAQCHVTLRRRPFRGRRKPLLPPHVTGRALSSQPENRNNNIGLRLASTLQSGEFRRSRLPVENHELRPHRFRSAKSALVCLTGSLRDPAGPAMMTRRKRPSLSHGQAGRTLRPPVRRRLAGSFRPRRRRRIAPRSQLC